MEVEAVNRNGDRNLLLVSVTYVEAKYYKGKSIDKR